MTFFTQITHDSYKSILSVFSINTSPTLNSFEFITTQNLLTTDITINLNSFNNIFSLIFFIYILSFLLYTPLVKSKHTNITTHNLNEDEINSFQDVLILVLSIVSIFIFYISFFSGLIFTKGLGSIVFVSVTYNVFMVLTTIISVAINLRYYAVVFLNGAKQSRKILYTYILDVVSSISFNLRLFVQLMRIGIMLASYDMLTILYNEYIYIFESFSLTYNNYISLSWYALLVLRLLFEFGHIYILVTMQFLTIFFMIFWLVQFFFTAYVSTEREKSLYKV